MSNIEYVKELDGEYETCDLEVDHPDHQFYLANGVLTSNSHAVAYGIDSYMCAWLLTHHEEEWLSSYMAAMSSNSEKRITAFSEIKSMGYTITPIDINYATSDWTILPGKKFMPSFLTCKGIGEAAIEELIANRPYNSVYDLLWNPDGSWKHSKFNKRAFETLIKIGAFGSMELVGEDKMFRTYKQMHHILIENQDQLKKSPKRDPEYGQKYFKELLGSTRDMQEWSQAEKLEFGKDLLGNFDINLIISDEKKQVLDTKGVKSIDDWEKKEIYWFVVVETELKKTKNGKEYVLAKVIGESNKQHKMFMWGCKDTNVVPVNTAFMGKIDKSNFGFSSNLFDLRKIG